MDTVTVEVFFKKDESNVTVAYVELVPDIHTVGDAGRKCLLSHGPPRRSVEVCDDLGKPLFWDEESWTCLDNSVDWERVMSKQTRIWLVRR